MFEEDLPSIKPLYLRPRVVAAVVAVAAIGGVALALVHGGRLTGHRLHEAKHLPLTGMARVNARLFPNWLIEASSARDKRARRRADAAYRQLQAAVKDPQLHQTLARLHAVVLSPDLRKHADEVASLFDRWNARLEGLRQPYYVDGSVVGMPSGTVVLGEFYRVLARPRVRVQHLATDAEARAKAGERQAVDQLVQALDLAFQSVKPRLQPLGQTPDAGDS